MTNTTTTAPARFIPAAGLTATVNGTKVVAFWVNGAGWKIQASDNTGTTYSNLHRHEHTAVAEFNQLVEQYEAETPAEAPATQAETAPAVKLPAAAKGTTAKVSDPGHTALAIAALAGRIERGGKPGQAPIGVLNALAKRGHLKLTYQQGRSDLRQVVTGATLTRAGEIALARLTAAEREAAEHAARLAVIDNITAAA